MSADDYPHVLAVLTEYVAVRLLGDDSASDLTARTPLLELGVLNSVETSRLVAYIRETFGVRLPPTALTANNFRDLETIAGLVVGHRADQAGGEPVAARTSGDVRG